MFYNKISQDIIEELGKKKKKKTNKKQKKQNKEKI